MTELHFVQSWCAAVCHDFDIAIDREMIALLKPREQCFVEFALRCLINPANAEAGRVLAQLVKERAQLEAEGNS